MAHFCHPQINIAKFSDHKIVRVFLPKGGRSSGIFHKMLEGLMCVHACVRACVRALSTLPNKYFLHSFLHFFLANKQMQCKGLAKQTIEIFIQKDLNLSTDILKIDNGC